MQVETIGNATLYCADYRDIIGDLPPCELVVTSPPYADMRDYGDASLCKDWDGLMAPLANITHAPNCQILVILGQTHRDSEVWEYWRAWIETMRNAAWRYFGKYVWDKQNARSGNWDGRLAQSHDYIFHFNKQQRMPNKWIPVTTRAKRPYSCERLKDGTTKEPNSPHKFGQSHKIPNSTISIFPNMANSDWRSKHPATFPVELPKFLIKTFTAIGEVVLDPFMGSGTTGVAALEDGRKFVGVEIHEPYFDIACKRMEAAARAETSRLIAEDA
jgi:DNA modification methylase